MTPELGDRVLYWTELYGEMWPFAAIITRVRSETIVDLHVLGGDLLHTGDKFRVAYSATPVSQSWSWRPPRKDELRTQEAA
jgi:hypothetical protein